MKGKKTDTEFISEYIQECVIKGINTPDEIVKKAQKDIEEIDLNIKRVELLKVRRSKILDVISTFGTNKPDKSKEIKALSFFKIQHPSICQHICNRLKDGPQDIVSLEQGSNYSQSDLIFCIKQLIEFKVLSKSGKLFLRGDLFNDYMQFVFKEV